MVACGSRGKRARFLHAGHRMITAAMLKLIAEAGEGVLLLIEGLEESEFTRSRLTRQEVQRQLRQMADMLESLPAAAHQAMPEIDWPGWRLLAQVLRTSRSAATATAGGAPDDATWFAARALVPATLSWLRVYRDSTPALFDFKP